MTDLITLRGFVGSDPEQHMFPDGTMAARFRMATTTRRFDAEKQTWVDLHTNWYTVRCYRTLAMHVKASISCGQPVVVTGKLQLVEWASENGPRTIVQVDAHAIGHDLNFGTAAFTRPNGRGQKPAASADPLAGTSAEESEDSSEIVDVPEAPENHRMDAVTGTLIATAPGDDTFAGLAETPPAEGHQEHEAEGGAEEDHEYHLAAR